MTPGPGIEPGPHWWEASALTTAPSLLPNSAPAPILLSAPILLLLPYSAWWGGGGGGVAYRARADFNEL